MLSAFGFVLNTDRHRTDQATFYHKCYLFDIYYYLIFDIYKHQFQLTRRTVYNMISQTHLWAQLVRTGKDPFTMCNLHNANES